jgi:hypothetical protein
MEPVRLVADPGQDGGSGAALPRYRMKNKRQDRQLRQQVRLDRYLPTHPAPSSDRDMAAWGPCTESEEAVSPVDAVAASAAGGADGGSGKLLFPEAPIE